MGEPRDKQRDKDHKEGRDNHKEDEIMAVGFGDKTAELGVSKKSARINYYDDEDKVFKWAT